MRSERIDFCGRPDRAGQHRVHGQTSGGGTGDGGLDVRITRHPANMQVALGSTKPRRVTAVNFLMIWFWRTFREADAPELRGATPVG
jgi:hypothetical protein